MKSTTILSSALAAGLTAAVFAGGSAQFELVATTADAGIPGFPQYVWVPNAYGNPTITDDGSIYFTGKLGGADITTANARVIMFGQPGAFQLCARDGSAVLSGGPDGAVFNFSSGVNGLNSSTVGAPNGLCLISGNMNLGGVVATDDTMAWVGAPGAWSPIAREGQAAPGTAGCTMSSSMSLSSMKVNNNGQVLLYSTLAGGDSTTTNNKAIFRASPNGIDLICRMGDAVPGAIEGTLFGAPDSFNHYINHDGDLVFTATLAAGTGDVTTNNDKVLLSTRGGLHVVAREGSDIPGHAGLQFKSTGTFSTAPRTFYSDGSVLFSAGLQGDGVDASNDSAIFIERDGVFTMLLREGAALSDGSTFFAVNISSFLMTDTGWFAMQGITTDTTNNTFIAVGQVGQPLQVIAKTGAQIPGAPEGALYGNLNGSTNLVMNNNGQVYFKNTATGAVATTDNEFHFAWSAAAGLSTLLREGDPMPTGGTMNTFFVLGSTAQNGEGSSSCLSSSGWLAFNGRSLDTDGVNYTYFVGRVQLPEGASCPADLDASGAVDGADLAALLGAWGSADGDVDGNGATDGADLAAMLASWGSC